ncbi:MAG: iron hydrogenase small subunit [Elusimicrobiaceae bacterium]|nr:iron hydrogenase small subunit [Elusimicrobiaceae bacterium]
MEKEQFVTIEGKRVPIEGERNLLELIRKANFNIVTFCYHPELAVYGACRLCLVEVEGMGIVASCTVAPKDGMKVRVNSDEIRHLRRINLELLLSSGNHNCTLCSKSGNCKLQKLAKDMDVTEIRFKSKKIDSHKDATSAALVRDHSKCILCGNCVRICNEVQGIGAIDFAFRGFRSKIATAFNKELGQSKECVSCGQCARVCPKGALMPNSQEIEKVFEAINNPKKKVAVHIAPAVRVGLGEIFGLPQGQNVDGKIAAALRMLGFDYVYDTAFSADLTIVEEASEFIERFTKGVNLPQLTSCCPAWVNYVEKYAPEFLPNLSTARSPMQMMGPVIKADFEQKGGKREDLVVVAVMPCSAKKYEATREEFSVNGNPDTDYVVTTVGLARMIKEAGIDFVNLENEWFDMPFGTKTGAGVIFGASGGVMEAALRFALAELDPENARSVKFSSLRESSVFKEKTVKIGDKEIRVAVVSGLKNARKLLDDIKAGKNKYDFIEVMSCQGGCVAGAGQPQFDGWAPRKRRAEGLYQEDTELAYKSQDNSGVMALYGRIFDKIGGKKAHQLLHTHYTDRKDRTGQGKK